MPGGTRETERKKIVSGQTDAERSKPMVICRGEGGGGAADIRKKR